MSADIVAEQESVLTHFLLVPRARVQWKKLKFSRKVGNIWVKVRTRRTVKIDLIICAGILTMSALENILPFVTSTALPLPLPFLAITANVKL